MTKTSEIVSSLRREITERDGLMLAMNAVRGKTDQMQTLIILTNLRLIGHCLITWRQAITKTASHRGGVSR